LVPAIGRIRLMNWIDWPPWQAPLKYEGQPVERRIELVGALDALP